MPDSAKFDYDYIVIGSGFGHRVDENGVLQPIER